MKEQNTRGILQEVETLGRAMAEILPFTVLCYNEMVAGNIKVELTTKYRERLQKAFDIICANMDSLMEGLPSEFVVTLPPIAFDPADVRDLPLKTPIISEEGIMEGCEEDGDAGGV